MEQSQDLANAQFLEHTLENLEDCAYVFKSEGTDDFVVHQFLQHVFLEIFSPEILSVRKVFHYFLFMINNSTLQVSCDVSIDGFSKID